VELLVVIGIIATLAALVTPAVMRAQATARNAAIKAEIDMLHMAIMNYKNEYGSFPPALDTTLSASGLINRHILRLFPRTSIANPDNRASAVQVAAFFDDNITDRNTTRETRALVPWLMGFADDPTNPIGQGGIPRNKLFDFDQSRISSLIENRSGLTVTSYTYFPSGKKNSPYVYIPGHQYRSLFYESPSNNYDFLKKYGAQYMPPNPLPSKPSASTPDSWHFTNTTGNLSFFNNDTFQILCAGRDEEFGTDDDLSNFWRGTRRDYLDSLTQ
jgi:type II secretory pathway pseudopilin PulG